MARGKFGFVLGVLIITQVGLATPAEAAYRAGVFYRVFCEGIFKLFNQAVKQTDSAIEKVRQSAPAVYALAEGNVDYYGSFLKGHYETYLKSVETGLLEIAAMTKRAIDPDQAKTARDRIIALREAMVAPGDFDRAMDYAISRVKQAAISPTRDELLERLGRLKKEYLDLFGSVRNFSIESARVDSDVFWSVSDSVFATRLARMKNENVKIAFPVHSFEANVNPMHALMNDLNLQFTWRSIKTTEEWIRRARISQWAGPIEADIAAESGTRFVQAIEAILYENLKVITMGPVTGSAREIDPAILASLLAETRKRFGKAALEMLSDGETANLRQRLAAYTKELKDFPDYAAYKNSGLLEELEATLKLFKP